MVQVEGEHVDIVRSSTVGFSLIEGDVAHPSGSGTLMSFGNVKGILTCAHVALALQREESVGVVVMDGRPQQQSFKIEASDAVVLGAPPWSLRGPDLAFIRLPDRVVGGLAARATFIDGDKQARLNRDEQPAAASAYFQAVAGVIGDRTGIISETETKKTIGFNGMITPCKIRLRSKADGLDVLELEHDCEDAKEIPANFKGTSGGGIWKLFFKRDESGVIELLQARIFGVAYWERDDGTGLNAHGPTSIYEKLLAEIQGRWADANKL